MVVSWADLMVGWRVATMVAAMVVTSVAHLAIMTAEQLDMREAAKTVGQLVAGSAG
jgi:hypothetical protein